MSEEKLHVFDFTPSDNDGESLFLTTKIEDSSITQELSLECYGKSATINFGFDLTPERLRQLANELESFMIENLVR